MSVEFYQTRAGRTFYEVTLPKAIQEIGRLADSITELNQSLHLLRNAEHGDAPHDPRGS